jgi:hypothetical protein
MNDCQIVLRYFALLKDDHIRGSMRSILDGCMKRNQNASPQIVEECARLFIQSIEACDAIFKGDAFLLPPDTSGKQRQSVALYDSLMVGLYRNRTNIESLLERKTKIRAKVETTIKHNAALFTAKANTAQSIKDRISKISAILGNPL